jgi:hypothetical protein
MILDSSHTLRFCFVLLLAAIASGHDIPRDATVQAFLRPAGTRLQMIVRVPLGVIRDVPFPEDERGYLRLEALAPMLPELAGRQIAPLIEIYEGDKRLPSPRITATQISLESDRSFTSFEEALATSPAPGCE